LADILSMSAVRKQCGFTSLARLWPLDERSPQELRSDDRQSRQRFLKRVGDSSVYRTVLNVAMAQVDPCCATNADATRDGDPLNFVVVEGKRDAIVPFAARGWHLAQKLSVASAIETARAFIFRDEYLTSPVGPLYLFGRREDLVNQKARSTINERVHARFWLVPYTFESRRIWGWDK
jgi:hypothetical protein